MSDPVADALAQEAGVQSAPANNPGNLRPTGANAGFQSYPTPEAGLAAIDSNLQAYGKKGINTLSGVISRWAPPSDNNNTPAYIVDASKRLGLDPNQPIDLSNPVQRHAIATAIVLHEQGPKAVFNSIPQPPPAQPTTPTDNVAASLQSEANGISTAFPEQQEPKTTWGNLMAGGKTAVGGVEAGLHAVTGAAGTVAGGLNMLLHTAFPTKDQTLNDVVQSGQDVTNAMTYQPRTEEGQNISKAPGDVAGAVEGAVNQAGATRNQPQMGTRLAHPSQTLGDIGETIGQKIEDTIPSLKGKVAPVLATIGATAPAAIAAAMGITKVPEAAAATDGTLIKDIGSASVPTTKLGSVGAAATDNAALARASVAGSPPELQKVVEGAIKAGHEINQEALDRHVDAMGLPKPMVVTAGQASQDPALISNELNNRGKYPKLANTFNGQNNDLIENTNLIREQAAPDVYVRGPQENAAEIIRLYNEKDTALNADVSAKYKALNDANGGQFPIDAKAFVNNADAALHHDLLYDHVPPAIRSTMDRLATGGMTFENFESMRTRLASIMRSNVDGNVKAAAGTIRQALEDLPLGQPQTVGSSLEGSATINEGANLKALADAARQAARTRFGLIESDPAYKAVVEGDVQPDKFMQKYVVGATKKDAQTMVNNLGDMGRQHMAAGTIDTMKKSAGINSEDGGNFSQSNYNSALDNLRFKPGVIFDPESAQQLERLGRVARTTQLQPRGSFANNSNTLVGALAEGAKTATKNVAEVGANLAIPGLQGGTMARKGLGKLQEWRQVTKATKPGAGILLRDIGR